MEIGRKLLGGPFSETGETVDTMVRSHIDAVPKQRLAH